jgi:hypothetical protein
VGKIKKLFRRNVMKFIVDGIEKLEKPQNVQVGTEPGWKKPVLNVLFADGTSKGFRISKKVAEALIASGMGYEG